MRVAAFILALLGASPAFAQDVPGEWDSPVVLAGPLSTSGLLNTANLSCTPSLVCLPDSDSWNCVDGAGATVAVTQGAGTTFEQSPCVPGPSGTTARYAARIDSVAKAPTIAAATANQFGAIWNSSHTFVQVLSQTTAGTRESFGHGTFGADGFLAQTSAANSAIGWWGAASINRTSAVAPFGRVVVLSFRRDGTTYTARGNGNTGAPTTNAAAVAAPTGQAMMFGTSSVAARAIDGLLHLTAIFPCALTDTELTRIEQQWAGTIAESRNVPVDRNSTAGWVAPDGVRHAVGDDMGRVDERGLLVEEGRTNRLTYSRDFSNVAWTKTNLTAALTQTGLDGVANSASLLTATAANGTAIQSIAGLASTARINTAYLKRGVGSGAVELTSDNGGTWTPVTLTAAFQRFEIARTANTGIDFGIRIVTSGDTVIADFAQAEEGTAATQAIATTTTATARLMDAPSVSTIGWPTKEGRLEVDVTPEWSSGGAYASTIYVLDSRTASNGLLLYFTNTSAGTFSFLTGDGATTTITSGALTWTAGTTYRIRAEWGGGNTWLYRNGALIASNVTGAAKMPSAHLASALLYAGAAPMNGWIRNLSVGQR